MNQDNPPAFPRPYSEIRTDTGHAAVESQSGMTLRDHFAGLAMSGILANGGDVLIRSMHETSKKTGSNIYSDVVPAFAYDVADAMIKERAKRG